MSDYVSKFRSSKQNDLLLAQELFVVQATDEIAKAMKVVGISKAKLAALLGKSKSWVSQVLSGDSNLTLKTIAEISWALGSTPRVVIGWKTQFDPSVNWNASYKFCGQPTNESDAPKSEQLLVG